MSGVSDVLAWRAAWMKESSCRGMGYAAMNTAIDHAEK